MTPFVEFIIKYPATIDGGRFWHCAESLDVPCEIYPKFNYSHDCNNLTKSEFNYILNNHPELFI